jgi:hypothetical protein
LPKTGPKWAPGPKIDPKNPKNAPKNHYFSLLRFDPVGTALTHFFHPKLIFTIFFLVSDQLFFPQNFPLGPPGTPFTVAFYESFPVRGGLVGPRNGPVLGRDGRTYRLLGGQAPGGITGERALGSRLTPPDPDAEKQGSAIPRRVFYDLLSPSATQDGRCGRSEAGPTKHILGSGPWSPAGLDLARACPGP